MRIGYVAAFAVISSLTARAQTGIPVPTQASTPVQSETNTATVFLAQVLAKYPALAALHSVTIGGTAQWTAGSLHESGSASIQAGADGSSTLQLNLDTASRTESRTAFASRTCQWVDSKSVTHDLATPDCFEPVSWAAPWLGVQPSLPANVLVVSDDGAVTRNGSTYRQVSYMATLTGQNSTNSRALTSKQLTSLTRVSVLYDPTTLLPFSVEFDEHPSSNLNLASHVRVVYSAYQSVSGIQLPYRIDRYVNNVLQLTVIGSTVSAQ